jgi:DNA invertase Pin-like site-specific DNA recombinase
MNYNNEPIKYQESTLFAGAPNTKKRMAAYCRVSTKDEILLKSLENQISYFLHLGGNNDSWHLVGLYVDRGISGTSQKHRRSFKRLIRHCEEGKIDVIITKSISRFSRNSVDLMTILRKLRSLDVEVIFQREGIKTSEVDTDFILNVYGAFAEREAVNIAQNVEWSYRKQFERGIPKFDRILGYDVKRNKDSIEISIIPEEANIVNEIYEKFISGVSIADIAKSLNERNIPTIKNFQSWQRNQITYVLKNSRYLGDTISHPSANRLVNQISGSNEVRESILIPNSHPPIIDSDKFDAAQEIFLSRKVTKGKYRTFPLSKRVRCGRCGANFVTIRQYNNKKRWGCHVRNKDNCLCESVIFWEYELKDILVHAIESRFGSPTKKVLDKLMSIVKSIDEIDNIESQRIEYYKRLQNTKKSYSTGEVQNDNEVKRIEKEFLLFEKVSVEIEDDRYYRKDFLSHFSSFDGALKDWNDLTLAHCRALIREAVIFDKSTIKVHWCDARVTTIGNCPIHWPTNPIESKTNFKDVKNTGKKRIISTNSYQSIPKVQPVVSKINSLYEMSSSQKQKVAAYCRVSTLNEEQLHSLAIQIAYYVNLILQNPKWVFAGIYIDEGISGIKIDNRPEFKKMISNAKANKIDLIITKSVSRFARNTLDCLAVVRELKSLEKPTGVWFEKENIHTLSNMGELTLSLFSSLAQEEALNFGANIRLSKIKNIERGNFRHSGLPPYGFTIDSKGVWHVVKKQREVIQTIYSKFHQGLSLKEIVKYLADSNIPTPRNGVGWRKSYLRKLLSNQVYIGNIVYQKKFVKNSFTQETVKNNGGLPKYLIENHHEAIIDLAIWNDVQLKLDDISRGPKNKKYKADPLKNLIYCAECGKKVIVIGSRGIYKYRKCSSTSERDNSENMFRDVDCTTKGYRCETIEHAFMVLLENLRNDSAWLKEAERLALKYPLTHNQVDEKKSFEELLQSHYKELHKNIDAMSNLNNAQSVDVTELVNKILENKKNLRKFDEMLEEGKKNKESYYWFLDQINNLPVYDSSKFRISFREDIFKRVVRRAYLTSYNTMIYQFTFGSTVIDPGLDNNACKYKLIF